MIDPMLRWAAHYQISRKTDTQLSVLSIYSAGRAGSVLAARRCAVGRRQSTHFLSHQHLTQSTWPHAAYFVGRDAGLRDNRHRRFDRGRFDRWCHCRFADQIFGYNTRICRPALITEEDRAIVSDYIIKSIGQSYDVKNVVDLARILPQLPVPVRWRRMTLGSGEPTQAICSTLIAASSNSSTIYLPDVTRENQREIMHIRHHSLFTPRDFDVSPYFNIVG